MWDKRGLDQYGVEREEEEAVVCCAGKKWERRGSSDLAGAGARSCVFVKGCNETCADCSG